MEAGRLLYLLKDLICYVLRNPHAMIYFSAKHRPEPFIISIRHDRSALIGIVCISDNYPRPLQEPDQLRGTERLDEFGAL